MRDNNTHLNTGAETMKTDASKSTVRQRLAEMTAGLKTQVDLDAFVSRGGLRALKEEFPGSDNFEILYEWDSRKLTAKSDV